MHHGNGAASGARAAGILSPSSDRQATVSRLGRLMLIRVLVVTILMLGMVLSNYLMGTTWLLEHPYARTLIGLVVFQYLASIMYGLVIRRVPNLVVFFYVQLFVDLVSISMVVHLTGGAASGFTGLYIIAVVAASVVDLRRGALWAGAGSIVSFIAVSLTGYFKILPALTGQKLTAWEMMPEDLYKNLGVNVAAVAAVTLLSAYLADQFRRAGRRAQAHREAFLDLNAHHQEILRRLDSGIVSTDGQNRILTMNRAAETICGIPSSEAVGGPLDNILPGLTKKSGSERLTLIRRDGVAAAVEVTVSPLEGSTGPTPGLVYLVQDRTAFERMEEEVRRAERLAMLGRFAAGVAHEIRNPLASISGSIELLKSSGTGNDEDSKLMDIVVREVDRLDRLIGDLLEFTRPSPLKPENIDICQATGEAVRLFQAEPKNGELRINLDCPEPVRTAVDPSRFRQLLWNLLKNAADVTPKGGRIQVHVTAKGGVCCLEVADQGPGIPEQIKEKIFEPFFTTKPDGTGLGLAACHQIANDHGGRIEVLSPPGGGCTFSVQFPQVTE